MLKKRKKCKEPKNSVKFLGVLREIRKFYFLDGHNLVGPRSGTPAEARIIKKKTLVAEIACPSGSILFDFLFDLHEIECGGVNAVSFVSGSRPVVKYMTQMGTALGTNDLYSFHKQAAISFQFNVFL